MPSKSLSYTESIDKRSDEMEGRQSPSMIPGMEHRVEPSTTERGPIPLHYRTNFGKKMGYVPPDTSRVPPRSSKSRRSSSNYGEDVPFDQARDRRTTTTTTRVSQTIREPIGRVHLTQAAAAKQYTTPPMARVLSDRSRPFDETDQSSQATTDTDNSAYIPMPTKKAETDWEASSPDHDDRLYHSDLESAVRFRIPPLRVADPLARPVDLSRDISMEMNMSTPERPSIAFSEFGVDVEQQQDDDSLFDFEKEERSKPRSRKWRNGNRRRRTTDDQNAADDTDTSQEHEYGDRTPTLQERAQAAWKLKRKSHLKAASADAPPPPTTTTATTSPPMVSFDARDTVHHYQPDADTTEVTTLEGRSSLEGEGRVSLEGRSLNSEYTKSMESEVEDALKDIFLIGNPKTSQPGRRKVKDNPRIQEQLQLRNNHNHEDLFSYEEETTLEDDDDDDDSSPPPRRRSDQQQQQQDDNNEGRSSRRVKFDEAFTDEKKDDDDGTLPEDPLSDALNWMGLGAVLGLDDEREDEERYRGGEHEEEEDKDAGGLRGLMDYATDLVLGKTPSCEKCNRPEADEPGVIVPSAPSLEEDLRLLDLAEQAAFSYHRLKGYDFDESYEIDIVDDIKFTVVDLKLPLGLIFQENERGCWVTKVLPDGSAAKSKSIEIGDQLAAIDGYSAIDMKVDEIAASVRKHGKEIELTFLRYVGPIRPAPGSLQEEGYEIRATEKELKQKKGLRRLMMSDRHSKPRKLLKAEEKQSEAKVKNGRVETSKPAERKRFRIFGRRKQAQAY